MAKYRKKPVVIEAVQWTGANVDEILGLTFTYVSIIRKNYIIPDGGQMPGGALIIPTLEGDHTANPGDWIIKGVNNEFYPCKPDIFDKTYDPA